MGVHMNDKTAYNPPRSVLKQVALLPDMPIEEIKSLWRQLYRKETPTHVRAFLEKRLAFKLQELAFRADQPKRAAKKDRQLKAIAKTDQKPLKERYAKPAPGTVLNRTYKDRQLVVTVMYDGQFEFEGRLYTNLSTIANEVTGSKWSGPLFFGLRKTPSYTPKKRKRT